MLKRPIVSDGFQGRLYKDRVRERVMGNNNQLVHNFLFGGW